MMRNLSLEWFERSVIPNELKSIAIIGSTRFRTRVIHALSLIDQKNRHDFCIDRIRAIVQFGIGWCSTLPFVAVGKAGVVLVDYNSIRNTRLSTASYLIYLNCILQQTTLCQRLFSGKRKNIELELECMRTQIEFVEMFDTEAVLRHCLVMNYHIIKRGLVSEELCDWSERQC
jgi:hypothetical protein